MIHHDYFHCIAGYVIKVNAFCLLWWQTKWKKALIFYQFFRYTCAVLFMRTKCYGIWNLFLEIYFSTLKWPCSLHSCLLMAFSCFDLNCKSLFNFSICLLLMEFLRLLIPSLKKWLISWCLWKEERYKKFSVSFLRCLWERQKSSTFLYYLYDIYNTSDVWPPLPLHLLSTKYWQSFR